MLAGVLAAAAWLVKAATVLLLSVALGLYLLSRPINRAGNRRSVERTGALRALTARRQQRPVVFLSYTGAHKPLATACADVLLKAGFEVAMFDPDDPWDDPADNVINAIVTASVLVHASGGARPSAWIEGEIEFGQSYGVPSFEIADAAALTARLDEIRRAAAAIDLPHRLGDDQPDRRFQRALRAFGRRLDVDHYHGSIFINQLNLAAKQGGDGTEELIGCLAYVGAIVFGLAGAACAAVWWLFL